MTGEKLVLHKSRSSFILVCSLLRLSSAIHECLSADSGVGDKLSGKTLVLSKDLGVNPFMTGWVLYVWSQILP